MQRNLRFKVPKKRQQVTLWVHPEGKVVGSLFLHFQTKTRTAQEEPLEVLNERTPFVVLQRENPDELRFYNKSAIVRVEYHAEKSFITDMAPLHCRLYMMDGALITGTVKRALPPTHARLYDYLNMNDEPFVMLYMEDDDDDSNVCLVNKSYIVCVTHLDESNVVPIVPIHNGSQGR